MRESPARHPAFGDPITLEEWEALDEDEPGEWVDGRLEAEEMPDYLHEVVVAWFARLFGNWLANRGGFVGSSGAKFVVDPKHGRKPDLSVYLPGSPLPPARGLVLVPPDVMLEVLSRGSRNARRDRVEKLHEYAAFGVRWYWLVDPVARTLEIFERDPGGLYERRLVASDGLVDPVPGCAGLRVDLAELWAHVDVLERRG